MKIYDNIREEKLQYDIKQRSFKNIRIWSGKNDKYEYLTG